MHANYFPRGDYTSGSVMYGWRCSRCGNLHFENREFTNGDAVWIPDPLPEGWNKVGHQIFCPAHRVETFIDYKLAGTEGQQ